MYIEYTPLEGHIQTILRNPATAAALLAHVEAEEAATQVLQVQAEAVEDYNDVDAAAAAVAYRIAAPGAAGARVTDTVQDRAHFTIKARRSDSAENTLRAALELVPKIRVDQCEEEEEDEEVAEYELFDVIDAEDEPSQHQKKTAHLPPKLHSVDHERGPQTNGYPDDYQDLADAADNIVIELEDEEYDYVVTKVRRKSDSKNYSLNNREARFFHKAYSTPIASAANSKPKRSLPSLHPLPALLPCSSSSHNLRQTKSTPGLKLLNGNLHKFYQQRSISEDSNHSSSSSRASSHNSYIYVPHRQRRSDAHTNYQTSKQKNFVLTAEEEYYDEDVDFDYIDSTTEVKLNNEFPVVDALSAERLDSQMGIDILNKIRKLLHIQTGTDFNDNKRKRRSDNWSPDAADAHQIKYRKVENHFPKIITGPLDDDNIDSFPYPKKPRKPLLLQQHHRSSKSSPLVMSQRSSIHSIEKPKQRKSLFAPPQTTHKLVKNASYADVEFSDDDEPELLNGFGFSASNVGLSSQHSLGKTPKFYNIPISHRAEERLQLTTSLSSAKPPPPPLIEARSGSILASSLLPEMRSAAGRPSYAETLRHNITSFGGHVLGRAPSTVSSSGASTSASARANYNGLSNCIRTNPWGLNSRSILTQEKESEDREKYQELLKQLVPRIYGTDENAFSPSIKTQPCINLSRRRSALMVSGANNISASANSSNFANNQQQTLAGKFLSKQQQQQQQQLPLKRPPLSSTINLDDEDDDEDEVTLVDNVLSAQGKSVRSKHNNLGTVIIDDDDISEIIDLGDEERNMLSACSKLKADLAKGREEEKEKEKENLKKKEELPYVEPVNSLKLQFSTSPHLKDNWLENWQLKWDKKKKERKVEALKIEKEAQKHTDVRRAAEVEIQERLKNFQIFSPDLLVIDDFPEPVVDEEPEFVELNAEYQARIKAAICGPPDQVLVSKFNLNITRRDVHTLLGHSWLNDEVINFYMNLLTERGELRHESDGLPRVYAMNTFFIPRLMQAGHGGVKRWTRKVDIFAKDVIPVPVHVGGVHWCMAIIHLKNRTIKYYDSMGTPNPSVLKALEQYLKDESMDKRKQPFDTSQFEVESVRDVPRQMNGSDCGVFSCMFAEYVTRNKEITFSQQHMEYFRHKMILEIVRGELLQ